MLFGKQEKDSDDANQKLASFMEDVKKSFNKVDRMLIKSITPLKGRVEKLEYELESKSREFVALKCRVTELELASHNQAETIRDEMQAFKEDIEQTMKLKIEENIGNEVKMLQSNCKNLMEKSEANLLKVKEDLRGDLEQTMKLKIENTKKGIEESVANEIETLQSNCKDLMEKSEANLLKVVKEDLEQTTKLQIELMKKKIENNIANEVLTLQSNCKKSEANLLSKIDDVQTDLEVAQDGYLNEIKQVQEDNDILKSRSDVNDTRIIRVKNDFEEFKTVEWNVLKRDMSTCGTNKVRILNKQMEQFKKFNQRMEKMSISISGLEETKVDNLEKTQQVHHKILKIQRDFDILKKNVDVRHCNKCNKKFTTTEGLLHHNNSVHTNEA